MTVAKNSFLAFSKSRKVRLALVFSTGFLVLQNVSAQQLVPDKPVLNNISMLPLSKMQQAEHNYRLGIVLARRGKSAQAIEYLTRSSELDELNPAAVLALAKLYYSQKQYHPAITVLKTSLRLHANNKLLTIQLAHCYLALGELDKLIYTLKSRPGSQGGDIYTSSLLAYAYIQTGEFNKAAGIYQTLSLSYPDTSTWRLGNAIALEGIGDSEKALLVYADLKQQHNLSQSITQFVNSKIISLHEGEQ